MSDQEIPRIELSDFTTFRGRSANLYHIRTVDNKLVPFKFTESQEMIDSIIEEEYERNKRERGVEEAKVLKLKCRQIGSTTYDAVKTFDELANVDMCNAITMAHNTDTTELIYDIIKRVYDNCPEYVIITEDGEPLHTDKKGNPIPIKVRPTTKSYSGKRMAFEENDSRSTIQTAGSRDDAIKGVTLNVLSLSEFANFPDGSATLTSGMPSLAHNGRKYVSIESTANGVSGVGADFYNLWQKSVKDWEDYRAGRATTFDGFRPIFIPWYTIERYIKPLAGGQLTSIDTVDFGSPEIKKHYLQQEEKWTTDGIYDPLHEEKVVLSKDQINWYRTMMKDIAGYDYRKAQRYYPTTPEDAFVASNHCYFDMNSLQEIKTKYLNDGEPECEVGEVVWNDEGEVEFVTTTTGNLKVWEKPDREWENRYIISGDIGRGYEDGDYSVAKVKDILKQKYVARWKGRIDQTQFAEVMNMLGLWYNEGLLAPERNLDTVSEILKPDGLRPYVGEMYYDRTAQTIKWGFWTGNNREKMLEFYKTWLREEGYEVLPDLEEINQHISFVRVLKTRMVKYEADEGAFDDIILANSILNEAERWWLEEGVEPRKYNPDNFIEVIKKPIKKKIRRMKQSQLGIGRN